MSDELLARHAARGSRRAFSLLYERYHQRLYRYCRSIVREDADAQDALQSTFTRALDALQRDQRNAPLRPWLYRIAHNESITLLRGHRRQVEHQALAELPRNEVSADEAASAHARWEALVEDLATLPERQRGALLLRELAGLSHEDIGVALGVTTGGAKQAIFEARQALAEVQEGRAMSCERVRRQVSEGDRRVLRGRRIRAHLRDCAGCGAFAVAIDSRPSDLKALTPGLPPAAAAAVLTRALSAASPQGGASSMAGSATAATAIGKAASTAVAWKALTGAAVLVTAAAGVTGLTHALQHHPVRRATHRESAPLTRSADRRAAAAQVHSRSTAARARALAAASHHGQPTWRGPLGVAGGALVHGRRENALGHRGAGVHGARGHSGSSATKHGMGAGSSASHAHRTASQGHASGLGGSRRTSATSSSSTVVKHQPSGTNSPQSLLQTVRSGLGSMGAAARPGRTKAPVQ